ncbi:MAG: glycoside hydrolase family 10 [Planctomycetota bacterium]
MFETTTMGPRGEPLPCPHLVMRPDAPPPNPLATSIIMGQMQFSVPEPAREFFDACHWSDAYLCGIEGVPWPSRNSFQNDQLIIQRSVDSSAKLHITCPVPELGYRVLTTCSLRCDARPHRFLLELARGSCYRVRVQSDTWQRGGLALSDRFDELLQSGTQAFLDVASNWDDSPDTTKRTLVALAHLESAADELGSLFAEQSIAFRRKRETRLTTMLAAGIVPSAPSEPSASETLADRVPALNQFSQSFNAAAIRMSWGDIQQDSGELDFQDVEESVAACQAQGLRIIGGPLVDQREGLCPDWLALFDDRFDKLVETMTSFLEKTVTHFRGRVNLWNAATALNTAGPLKLDDEQVMHLSITALQTIRRCDPTTPVVISLDQPCGEYLSRDQNGISPLHFADALLRSGLGLAGIGLNFRFGFAQHATSPLSTMDFGQTLDRWGTLNAPLMVQLSVAGAPGNDDLARLKTETYPMSLQLNGDADAWADWQNRFAGPLIRTLLAKPIVHAIVWESWSDQHPHVSPHSGLLDSSGKQRPLLDSVTTLRKELLS